MLCGESLSYMLITVGDTIEQSSGEDTPDDMVDDNPGDDMAR